MALDALLTIERGSAFADEVLDERLSQSGLDPRDRALVFELVYGVLRNQASLDWRLNQVATAPVERLPAPVRAALRLGAYQLLFLQKIPPSAAVNESVTLVKALHQKGRKDWTGFANAVLRSLIRTPAPPWPDPAQDPVKALSIRYSCPSWLTQRWTGRFGPEGAAALCRATAEIPPLTIRVNTLHTVRESLAARFAESGHQTAPTVISPVGLIVEKSGPVTDLPLFREGAFYVEDEAAQLVARLLDPQPGERIWDVCAAPGGKTTHLAALMQDRGEIVATDRNAARLRFLDDNCRRLGISIVSAVRADATNVLPEDRRFARPFDRVLLDAPCSALGVLRRHPEGKWRKGSQQLARHQASQRQLLERAGALLRPGGVLVYSTCSTEPEENEQVVDRFCQEHAEFRRESVAPWLPPVGLSLVTKQGDLSTVRNAYRMDAFFAARLRKAS